MDITVVTASVNRPSLRRTCESVQAQTLRPVKHCILLQQMMKSPEIQIPKPTSVPIDVRWLPPPQPNIVEAYNAACAMAATHWVAMLDDDCWWEPTHLEVLAGLMERTAADFVWGSSILHDERSGVEVGRRDDPVPAFEHIDTNEILFRRSCIKEWGNHMEEDADPRFPGLLRGIDGKRIERWVKNGAIYAHSPQYTVHYGWRDQPEF
jgi:hypothetical protein